MGYSQSVVEEALKQQKFDDCYASYLLLGRRNTDVSLTLFLYLLWIKRFLSLKNYLHFFTLVDQMFFLVYFLIKIMINFVMKSSVY